MNLIKTSAAILVSAALFPVSASDLDNAQRIQASSHQAQAVSQVKIDKSAEAALALQADIEQLSEEVANLRVYRDHLATLVRSQEQEVASLDQQIEQIADTRQGVVPLMYQMLAALSAHIETDRPIRLAQRQARLDKLEQMMRRADVADAEKFRRILEAYQIEMDYGTKMAVYQDTVALEDKIIEADVFYLGRVALIARSLSGEKFWSWSPAKQQWSAVDAQLNPALDNAFAVAAQQIAPTLLTLPVSVTQANGEEH